MTATLQSAFQTACDASFLLPVDWRSRLRNFLSPVISRGKKYAATGVLVSLSCSALAQTQNCTPEPAIGPRVEAYPARTTDPVAVARGATVYERNGCSFCHGKDTRGGDGGPSLLRSQLVLR